MKPSSGRALLVARLAGDVTASDSDRKLALVLPGGGMRGAWQIAALSQIEDLGLRHGFDLVVGSSAGGMNACYFAAGQAHAGVSIYTDYLTGHALKHRFVDPKRVHKVMDIDWLVDVVLRKAVRLDTEALVRARHQVLVVVSNLRTGRPEVFDQHEPELFEVLRATSALPVLYGRQPLVHGTRYSDGGLTAPSPIDQAVAAGATDIVVLSPTPRGQGQQPMGMVADSLTRLWLTHAGGPSARGVEPPPGQSRAGGCAGGRHRPVAWCAHRRCVC